MQVKSPLSQVRTHSQSIRDADEEGCIQGSLISGRVKFVVEALKSGVGGQ
jgi:hypothetical protein